MNRFSRQDVYDAPVPDNCLAKTHDVSYGAKIGGHQHQESFDNFNSLGFIVCPYLSRNRTSLADTRTELSFTEIPRSMVGAGSADVSSAQRRRRSVFVRLQLQEPTRHANFLTLTNFSHFSLNADETSALPANPWCLL